MTLIKCRYYHKTGFRDGNSWEPGTILGFVSDRDGTSAIVLPEGRVIAHHVRLADVEVHLEDQRAASPTTPGAE